MIRSVFDFDNELHQMNEEELRSLLRELYLRTDMAMSNKNEDAQINWFAEKQQQLFSRLSEDRRLRERERPLPDLRHADELHIAIGEAPLGSIKVAMGNFPGRSGRCFFSLNDYYAMGPLGDLEDEIVLQRRHLWLLDRLYLTEHGSHLLQGLKQLKCLKPFMNSISNNTKVIIWYTNNGHERTGMLYALYLLIHCKSPITLMDTTVLYRAMFNASEQQVLPLGEMMTDQLSMMWEQGMVAKSLSFEQRSLMEQEWLELASQSGTLRLMKNDAVHSVPENSLDEFILQQVKRLAAERAVGEFINGARVVGEVMGNLTQAVGDSFIEYRVRQLVLLGKLDLEGSPRAMRFYRVRLTGEG
ncbi:DUF3658 domain-containing protein [Paenibacillus silvae]|jgi:hypothetical protein|uniref:DUF1835 domain-containing protein n=1 Tax=Paenibacillus silvae TaxID=1325358 RepID=UPI0025A171B2|nr:DUF1835 domain-containing protein [Paenibacillus silvae]MDM5280966.1 DUF3658 domain-containing protein [Paenibacillus silvae]